MKFTIVTQKLFGSDSEIEIEHRIFNIISFIGSIAGFSAGILCLSLNLGFYVIILVWGFACTLGSFYYISRFLKIYKPIVWPTILITLLFLSMNWFVNAGSQGPSLLLFLVAFCFMMVLVRGTKGSVFLLLLGISANIITLFFIEHLHPDWIDTYKDQTSRYVDLSISSLIGFIMFAAGMTAILNRYHQEKRTAEEERGKADKLLLNILPASIASELKEKGESRPVFISNASVIFTDIVDFTRISTGLSPEELVTGLEECFTKFDEIVYFHKIEKLKTLGDGYMGVGGLPVPNNTHPFDVCLAALEMMEFMDFYRKKQKKINQKQWNLRIGIHTGHLVAGIIGKTKFAYDVWGDTVNIASRHESASSDNRINVSSETYNCVKDYFRFEIRGGIEAKGRGKLNMYYLKGLSNKFSKDKKGLIPNSLFNDIYSSICKNGRI